MGVDGYHWLEHVVLLATSLCSLWYSLIFISSSNEITHGCV